jgi:hypothetical protein
MVYHSGFYLVHDVCVTIVIIVGINVILHDILQNFKIYLAFYRQNNQNHWLHGCNTRGKKS